MSTNSYYRSSSASLAILGTGPGTINELDPTSSTVIHKIRPWVPGNVNGYYYTQDAIASFLRSTDCLHCDEVADVTVTERRITRNLTEKRYAHYSQNLYERTLRRSWAVSVSVPKIAKWIGREPPRDVPGTLFEAVSICHDSKITVGNGVDPYAREGFTHVPSEALFVCIFMGNWKERNEKNLVKIGPALCGWWNAEITSWSQPVGGLENFTFTLTPFSIVTYFNSDQAMVQKPKARTFGDATIS